MLLNENVLQAPTSLWKGSVKLRNIAKSIIYRPCQGRNRAMFVTWYGNPLTDGQNLI